MHPTPAEIRTAIQDKLVADFKEHKGDAADPVPFIPHRAMQLVNQAITEACDRKELEK